MHHKSIPPSSFSVHLSCGAGCSFTHSHSLSSWSSFSVSKDLVQPGQGGSRRRKVSRSGSRGGRTRLATKVVLFERGLQDPRQSGLKPLAVREERSPSSTPTLQHLGLGTSLSPWVCLGLVRTRPAEAGSRKGNQEMGRSEAKSCWPAGMDQTGLETAGMEAEGG